MTDSALATKIPPEAPTGKVAVEEAYGWIGSDPAYSVGYVWPVVLERLRKVYASSVLDLGCGNGAMTRLLSENGFDVVGYEPDLDGLKIAQHAVPGVRFERLGVYDEPPRLDKKFDAVVSSEVIEHLMFPDYLPRFAKAVLKPGGTLILTTPFHGYWKNLSICLLNKWDSHHDSLHNGWHVKFWSAKTLSTLCKREGFVISDIRGCGRPYPFWKSIILSAALPK